MKMLRPAMTVFVLLSLLTGIVYPALVAGVGAALFGAQAGGSLIRRGDTVIGSAIIGQPFSSPEWFWGRPSATAPMPYNAASSGAANQGPTNPALIEAVKARVEALRASDPSNRDPIPQDLVTTSASGLDPHISPAAARWQVNRVAQARKIDPARLQALIDRNTERPLLGILGEPGVNVLKLNLALAAMG